ncbi:14237_t:CDS:10 [Dentiscutata erythropus]|uniref:ATP-binding cassette sub-family B member 6 n=1 Tax=Dentiscutata erythropus TaxID=1348616 RepID=A0A9N9H458_9GLOM|nr:14237_t:CDS:10 [Dentiscutata erythropus]
MWEVLFSCPAPPESGIYNPCVVREMIIYPSFLLLYIIIFGLYRYFYTLRNLPSYVLLDDRQLRRRLTPLIRAIYGFSNIILLSYFADCIVVMIRALESKTWTSTVIVFYDVVCLIAWFLNMCLMALERQNVGKWSWVNYLFYWVSLAGEASIFFLWFSEFNGDSSKFASNYDLAFFCIFVVRYVALIIASMASLLRAFQLSLDQEDAERSLLENSSSYGTFPSGEGENASQSTQQNQSKKSSLSDFYEKMLRLLPFLWPNKKPFLQFLVFICFGLLIAGRVVNVLVPKQLKVITDELTGEVARFPWEAILFYAFLRFLQSGVGLIQAAQNYLWIPIGQYTTREISVQMFEHLHGLSLSYHINRKTGEVLRVMDRGTNSIISLLNQILFQIFPVIVDIVVAVIFFVIEFGWIFGLIVFVTMSLYIFATVFITEWRTKFRREMIELDNDTRTKAVDSLLNFETVKYYNAERYEVQRYDDAIQKYQVADYKVSSSLNILNISQNLVITMGLLSGCLLCSYKVTQRIFTVGDFILFVTYINQLYSPVNFYLNFFGTYYRMIQQNFVDMEKMLDLFKEQQSVQDVPGAPDLKVTEGAVVFDNVSFSYDPRHPALKNISFAIPKGKTVALVGPSGGGKSTILRLLFRFYDVGSGRVLIDGQDIKLVKQESLRRNVGVVPQDTVLFNDTILYNIHYGNINAPEDDVYKAAKAAQIHDRILTFPDGYKTRVGERGLRLSGGEKQRVAIARTILKDPAIILLDEATSALDTTTERQIQHALASVTKDRTTLVIAHRLSTIVNADMILCIKDGEVAEQGTHDELLKNTEGNKCMWHKQLRDETENKDKIAEEIEVSNTDASRNGTDRHHETSSNSHGHV